MSTIPRGIRNNNPGNLKKTAELWVGEIKGTDQIFKTFATPLDGLCALKYSLNRKFARGLTQIRQIITSYAPSVENNTLMYIKYICLHMGKTPNEPLNLNNPDTLKLLMKSIVLYENEQNPYTNLLYDLAIQKNTSQEHP